MRTIILGTLFLIALVIFVLTATPAGQVTLRFFQTLKGESPSSSYLPPEKVQLSANPFGVALGAKNLDFVAKAEVVSGMGVSYYKPTPILMQSWRGFCVECEDALSEGLKMVVTIQAKGKREEVSGPPSDYEDFKKSVTELIEKYKPALVVVEDEEHSSNKFGGSSDEYLTELRIACSIAHEKGTKCTNGGINGDLVISPETEEARKAKNLLSQYRTSGADFVNFHFSSKGAEQLSEVVNFAQDSANLRAVTDRIGANSDDPEAVRELMQKIVDLHLPIAIWESRDVSGITRGLTDDSGKLRPTGEAFKNFLAERY